MTWWPSCWKCRSLRISTVWPRWRSGAVGSNPAFTRRGRPVLRLSSRRSRRSLSRIISAAPLCNKSICSSTDKKSLMPCSSINSRPSAAPCIFRASSPCLPHQSRRRTSPMPSVSGRAVQVSAAGGEFQVVQREFPEPGPGHVRIRVQACGVCHSDSFTQLGIWPGIQYPRVPGHEVAGVLDAVGPDVPVFKRGQRVGLGWHGGHCNYCHPCRRGDFVLCENQQVSGIDYDGGYADYGVAPANAIALIPDDLGNVDAVPLLCAGITTFNALRNSGARPGDTVVILGIGGPRPPPV